MNIFVSELRIFVTHNIDGIMPKGRTRQDDKIDFFGLLLK